MSGTSPTLQAVEFAFAEGFSGAAGTEEPFTEIAFNDVTNLAQVGNQYELIPAGGGPGLLLEYQGGLVTQGQFGAGWAPVGAEKTATGYEVVWGDPGANQYSVWNTDGAGDYTNAATGVLSGTSPTIAAVEANFGEDFAGSPEATPTQIATNGLTTLEQVGDLYELNPAGDGTGPLLEYQGSLVTAGQFGAGWAPVGAEQTANGYEVVWGDPSADQYAVWNTDSNGDYTNSATGLVSGQSFALEDLEPAFGEELNGDGKAPSQVLLTSANGPGDTLNLSSQTQSATINLGANSASANAGLNAPSLGFTGTPDAITLGQNADIVEYALTPSSGVETISNFNLFSGPYGGQDELNIDLEGAPYSSFEIYDTMVGGQHAISMSSSADPDHGVVLLNVPPNINAAALSASHLTFAGGHALISSSSSGSPISPV